MTRRFGWLCPCATVAWIVTACGGTVVDRTPPKERLKTDGAARCQAACKVLASCPSKDTCDCGCACPAGTPGCCDTVCMCGGATPSFDGCARDCSDAVDAELKSAADCAGLLLAVLDCVAGSSCTSGMPCRAEQQAYAGCAKAGAATTTPPSDVGGSGGGAAPTGGAPSANPPAAGGGDPAPTAGGPLTCNEGFGTSSDGPPAPGSVACENIASQCSDGREYRMTCVAQPDGSVACQCFASGVLGTVFVDASCDSALASMSQRCGWPL